MSKSMAKTLDDLISNQLWSAHKFLPHAQYIFPRLLNCQCNIKYGRSVVHISLANHKIKLYPHYREKNNEWVTFVNTNGIEKSFHYSESSELLYNELLKFINES